MSTPLELIDAYLDNVCTPEQFDELVAWLKASPENVNTFVERSYLNREIGDALVHAGMSDLFDSKDEWDVLHPEKGNLDGDLSSVLKSLEDPNPSATPLRDITHILEAQQALHKQQSDLNKASVGKQPDRPIVIVIPKALVYLAAAAMIALLVSAGTFLLPGKQAPTTTALLDEQRDQSPASLTDLDAAVWANGQTFSADTQLVSGQKLGLYSGVVELSFARGAVVTLEGPCQVQVIDDNSLRLDAGRIVALAGGSAMNFSVLTPTAEVIDYGTEFGVLVDADAGTKVAVFDGLVSLQSNREQQTDAIERDQPLMISGGMKAGVDREGVLSPTTSVLTESDKVAFARSLEDYRSPEFRYHRAIMGDSPIAYWRFESSDAKWVPNEVSPGTNDLIGLGRVKIVPDGAFGKAASLTTPQLPLAYYKVDGQLSFDPERASYTIECLYYSKRRQNASIANLFVESKESPVRAEFHASLNLTRDAGAHPNLDIPGWQPDRLWGSHSNPPVRAYRFATNLYSGDDYPINQWQHVALVKSPEQLSLYVNGELIQQTNDASGIQPSLHMILGASGMMTPNKPDAGGLPFVGMIDEVAVYNRALEPDEIAKRQAIWILQQQEENGS